jgi:hypothetical protein
LAFAIGKFIKKEGLLSMAYFSHEEITIIKVFMISIDDFKTASFKKKCELVTSQTSYVTSWSDDEKTVYLYHTGKFFIEVFYSPLQKRVLFINAFNDIKNVELYAESVSLEDLKL